MEIPTNDILKFWFKDCTPQQWFKKDADFDAALSDRFGGAVQHAMQTPLDLTTSLDDDCLAAILLLDQFARNIYRDTPQAFAGDTHALRYSQHCIAAGFINHESIHYRTFMLMPMMHSEDIAIQDASLPLFQKHASENSYDYAVKHRDIIARFNRFPHRNAVLGRTSTAEELEFLTQKGSSF